MVSQILDKVIDRKVIDCWNPLRNHSDIPGTMYNNIYYRIWYPLKSSTMEVNNESLDGYVREAMNLNAY